MANYGFLMNAKIQALLFFWVYQYKFSTNLILTQVW